MLALACTCTELLAAIALDADSVVFVSEPKAVPVKLMFPTPLLKSYTHVNDIELPPATVVAAPTGPVKLVTPAEPVAILPRSTGVIDTFTAVADSAAFDTTAITVTCAPVFATAGLAVIVVVRLTFLFTVNAAVPATHDTDSFEFWSLPEAEPAMLSTPVPDAEYVQTYVAELFPPIVVAAGADVSSMLVPTPLKFSTDGTAFTAPAEPVLVTTIYTWYHCPIVTVAGA